MDFENQKIKVACFDAFGTLVEIRSLVKITEFHSRT